MRYTDSGGDVWEDVDEGQVRVVSIGGERTPDGEPASLDYVTATWGPLTPITEDDERPSDSLPLVTDVMDRADVFQAAHALVTGLKWGESESASVYDVLCVAKWLEGEG